MSTVSCWNRFFFQSRSWRGRASPILRSILWHRRRINSRVCSFLVPVSHMTPNNSSPSSGSAMSNHVNPAPPSTQQVNGALGNDDSSLSPPFFLPWSWFTHVVFGLVWLMRRAKLWFFLVETSSTGCTCFFPSAITLSRTADFIQLFDVCGCWWRQFYWRTF